MKTIIHSLLTLAAALTLTACHDDGQPDAVNLAAVISGTQRQAATRASGTDAELQLTQFVSGMSIQVECCDHDPDDTGDHASCAAYTNSTGVYVTGTPGETTCPLSGTIYYPASGHTVDIRAYYPATVTSATTTFPATGSIASQTTLDAYRGFDLMYATPLTDQAKGSTHALTFHHALAQVIVNISPGNGVTAGDITSNVSAVTIRNTVAVATLTNDAGVITATKKADTAAADISILGTGAANVGLIVPQTVAKGSAFITVTYGGSDHTYSLPAAADKVFQAGYQYIYSFTMSAAGLVLESEQIVDWDSGGDPVTQTYVI